ncbi:MAG: TolC family protein [Rhodothermaceae bacterium]|nr:TolC family protein [Rhodothermaceae bacterium]
MAGFERPGSSGPPMAALGSEVQAKDKPMASTGSARGFGSAASLMQAWVLTLFLLPASAIADSGGTVPATVFDLTLEDAIGRALERNRPLLNRRLDREVERFALDVAGDRWRPRVSVSPFLRRESADRVVNRRAGVGARTTLRVPTGGEFALGWDEALSSAFRDTRKQTLSFTQPLLKGAWPSVETAPVRRARMEERIGFLALRQAVADLIVEVVGSYRALVAASRQVEIGETALRRAREQLEATRALIRAGRVARREAIRSEATVANRALSLARARNRLEAANFRLIGLLELGGTVRVRPLDGLTVEPGQGAPEPSLEEVLRSRADFRQARLRVEIARVGLVVARSNVLPDLSLGIELSRDRTGRSDSLLRLDAVIPLNDRAPELERLRARNALRKAERDLAELRESVGIALRQAVNDVEVGLRLIGLARDASALARENLAIERNKFGQGLSSTFEVAVSEDELVRAEQAELDARLAWLDARTRLDRVSGRTLARWGVALKAVEE